MNLWMSLLVTVVIIVLFLISFIYTSERLYKGRLIWISFFMDTMILMGILTLDYIMIVEQFLKLFIVLKPIIFIMILIDKNINKDEPEEIVEVRKMEKEKRKQEKIKPGFLNIFVIIITALFILMPLFSGLYVPEGYEKIHAVISKIEYNPGRYATDDIWIDYYYAGNHYEEVEYDKNGLFWDEGTEIDIYINPNNPEEIEGNSSGYRIIQGLILVILMIFALILDKKNKKEKNKKQKNKKEKE